jgi:hypothetical protein
MVCRNSTSHHCHVTAGKAVPFLWAYRKLHLPLQYRENRMTLRKTNRKVTLSVYVISLCTFFCSLALLEFALPASEPRASVGVCKV